MTAKEFYNQQVGKAVDIDYTAGVQCVDLFKIFTKVMKIFESSDTMK